LPRVLGLLAIYIVGTAWPGEEGPWSRLNRASAGQHPGRGRAATPNLLYAPG
jgi:hypothetical protein